jgi:hypothetical protein
LGPRFVRAAVVNQLSRAVGKSAQLQAPADAPEEGIVLIYFYGALIGQRRRAGGTSRRVIDTRLDFNIARHRLRNSMSEAA